MLKIECRESRDAILVDLIGRMTGGKDTRDLKDLIKSKLERGHRKFVVNLAELEWMTSIGIGVLVESYSSVKSTGGSFVLLSPTERVAQTLEMTRLTPTLFRVFHEESTAVAYSSAEAASIAADKTR